MNTPMSEKNDTVLCAFLLPLRLYVGLSFLLKGIEHLSLGLEAWTQELIKFASAGIAKGRVYEFYQAFLEGVIIPNAEFVAIIILIAHFLVGLMLIFGLFTRTAAVLAILMNLNFVLARGFTLIGPHTDGIFIAMSIAILIGNAGMCLGLDALFFDKTKEENSPENKTGSFDFDSFTKIMKSSLSKYIARYGFAVMRILVGVAFLVSARGKFLAGHEKMSEGMQIILSKGWRENTYSFYAPFLDAVVLPNIELFTFFIMWGELLVGIALVIGLFTRFTAFWALFINLNIALAVGASLIPPHADIAFILADIVLILSAAGRSLGFDSLIVKRFGNKILW